MRISALMKRILIQIKRDKRTLMLLIAAPILLLTVMNIMFNSDGPTIQLGVVDIDESLVSALEEMDFEIIEVDSDVDLEVEELEGILTFEDDEFELTLLNLDPTLSKQLHLALGQHVSVYLSQQLMTPINIEDYLTVNYVYGDEDTVFFELVFPKLLGIFVFFFTFLVSGIGLLRERMTGTLPRLLSTPISKLEIILGYLGGYGILAALQTILMVCFSLYILDVSVGGSILDLIIVNLLGAFVALSLGIWLSTFATSEFQLIQFIPAIVVPQVFLSGIFSLEGVSEWFASLRFITPIHYLCASLTDVMYKGLPLSELMPNLFILIGFILLFITLNVISLRRRS